MLNAGLIDPIGTGITCGLGRSRDAGHRLFIGRAAGRNVFSVRSKSCRGIRAITKNTAIGFMGHLLCLHNERAGWQLPKFLSLRLERKPALRGKCFASVAPKPSATQLA